jgi:hypothetical protein
MATGKRFRHLRIITRAPEAHKSKQITAAKKSRETRSIGAVADHIELELNAPPNQCGCDAWQPQDPFCAVVKPPDERHPNGPSEAAVSPLSCERREIDAVRDERDPRL